MSSTWANLFDASSSKEQGRENHSSNPNASIQNALQINDKIKESIGQNLFEHIRRTHQMIQSKHIEPLGKKKLKETLNFFVKTAKCDVKNLVDAQVLLCTIETLLSGLNGSQKIKFENIIRALDKLIINQVKQLRKLHFPVEFKTHVVIEKSYTEDLCQLLIDTLNQGSLQNVVTLLLGYHCIFNKEQATMLFDAALKIETSHSEDLLAFLKLRLFSKPCTSPETIDYNSLAQNHFLQEPSFFPDPNRNMPFLQSTFDEILIIYNNLWESKVKNQFNELIIQPFNSFIETLQHTLSSTNTPPSPNT